MNELRKIHDFLNKHDPIILFVMVPQDKTKEIYYIRLCACGNIDYIAKSNYWTPERRVFQPNMSTKWLQAVFNTMTNFELNIAIENKHFANYWSQHFSQCGTLNYNIIRKSLPT